MSNYTILRIQKLNDNASIRRSLKHAFREQDTPNADPTRLTDNSHFFADDVASAMQNIKMRWPDKIRKNGVRLVEFLVTASPDAMNAKTRAEQDAYFANSTATASMASAHRCQTYRPTSPKQLVSLTALYGVKCAAKRSIRASSNITHA